MKIIMGKTVLWINYMGENVLWIEIILGENALWMKMYYG